MISGSSHVELLERSVAYAVGVLHAVQPELLGQPTPCAGWDLLVLLRHTADSLNTLGESLRRGALGTAEPHSAVSPEHVGDPCAAVRQAAVRLLGAALGTDCRSVMVDDLPLSTRLLVLTGSIEVATHGWDVAQACRIRLPIPQDLADELFEIAEVLVPPDDRLPMFGPSLPQPVGCSASDRLVAYLGRQPRRAS